MNELSLFTGGGGGVWASKLLGHRIVGYVERDEYCQKIIRQRIKDGHWDDAPLFSDVRTFDGLPYRGRVDLVSGGFPCQPFSSATRGRKTAPDLWPEMLRVIREVRPRAVFCENVTTTAIRRAAEDCEALGYQTKAVRLSAADLGADHIRSRCWLLAYSDGYGELCRKINAEMEVQPSVCPSVWETYPDESRMDDGMADWGDRIRALGNGQVPAVAVRAWEILTNNAS